MESIVSILLVIIGIYLVIGVIAYFPLLKKGIPSFDESMHGTATIIQNLDFSRGSCTLATFGFEMEKSEII